MDCGSCNGGADLNRSENLAGDFASWQFLRSCLRS